METPNLQPVNSESIASVAYHRQTSTLVVRFKHGGLYAYQGVPEHQYTALLGARSVGQHFHQHIRPHFTGKKL